MPVTDRTTKEWRKGSRSSANEGGCVEVKLATSSGAVLVRDSVDPGGPCLQFSVESWSAFLHAARLGRFDRDT